MEAVNRLKEIDTEIDTVVVTSEDQTYIDAAMIFRKVRSWWLLFLASGSCTCSAVSENFWGA